MTAISTTEIDQWIREARAGNQAIFGQLLAAHRDSLRLLARLEIGRRLQGKVDASDVVQEAFLEAHRHFPAFQGHAGAQFACWLRTILATTLANTVRRYLGTQARDLRLEQDLTQGLDQSACAIERILIDPRSSPSQHVERGEQSRLVAESLARLPEDYQTVILLRHLEGLTFPEVATRMQRSVDSVEKLWMRGLAQLKRLVSEAVSR